MESITAGPQQRHSLELFYQPLRAAHRSLRFPCDASGRVDLDRLSDRERREYLYARVVTGHEFAWPIVQPRMSPSLLLTDGGR